MEEQYFALLIDADNVSAKYITPILTRAFQIRRDHIQTDLRGLDKYPECFLEAGTADEFDHADPAV